MLPPWVWLLHFRVETRHVHAERHLAKAGVARRKGRGLPTLEEGAEGGTERAERSGGLHKRSAEDWGYPLRRAIGAEPLSEVWLPYWCASAHRNYQGGRCGRERPAEVGSGRPKRLERGRNLPATEDRRSYIVKTMSSLIFHTEQEQAVIATDTLAVSPDGRAMSLTSKAFHVPHLRMVLAGTGCGGFLDRWLFHLNTRMIVPGIEALVAHTPEALRSLWESYRKEYGVPEKRTTTVYHFGFSEQTDTIKAYAYRSEDDFVSEERPYGIGVKPECSVPQPYNLPGDFRTMMDEQRKIQRTRPKAEQLYIGGEIIVHHLMKAGCSTFSTGYFEDIADDLKTIFSRFAPDGSHS